MTGSDDAKDEGFLRGWSRRKLAAKKPAVQPPLTSESDVEPDLHSDVAPVDQVDVDYIAALPPIDAIGEGSDIKPFLARGVPAELRNAALRRLWSATPGVRDYVDPAVDYAWDWNAPGGVPGGGGTLSQNRVAQMVRDLIGDPEETDEVGLSGLPAEGEVDRSNRTTPPVTRPDTKTEADTPEPQAVRTSDRASEPKGAVASKSVSEQGASHTSSPSVLPPKRHGGAVPT